MPSGLRWRRGYDLGAKRGVTREHAEVADPTRGSPPLSSARMMRASRPCSRLAHASPLRAHPLALGRRAIRTAPRRVAQSHPQRPRAIRLPSPSPGSLPTRARLRYHATCKGLTGPPPPPPTSSALLEAVSVASSATHWSLWMPTGVGRGRGFSSAGVWADPAMGSSIGIHGAISRIFWPSLRLADSPGQPETAPDNSQARFTRTKSQVRALLLPQENGCRWDPRSLGPPGT